MLVKGNTKLGRTIWCFSIPASLTCPGKTELCDSRCYAQRGMFCMPSVKASHMHNYECTLRGDFVRRMVREIRIHAATVVRIHTAGDCYHANYVRKWICIVKACPDTKFFIFTRSWRIKTIRNQLTRFAKCRNVRMWWSVDKETGKPPNRPKRVRCAYMSIDMNDQPDTSMDLVFRDYPLRGVIQKKINNVMVCPPENGATKLTCEQCQFCFRAAHEKEPTWLKKPLNTVHGATCETGVVIQTIGATRTMVAAESRSVHDGKDHEGLYISSRTLGRVPLANKEMMTLRDVGADEIFGQGLFFNIAESDEHLSMMLPDVSFCTDHAVHIRAGSCQWIGKSGAAQLYVSTGVLDYRYIEKFVNGRLSHASED